MTWASGRSERLKTLTLRSRVSQRRRYSESPHADRRIGEKYASLLRKRCLESPQMNIARLSYHLAQPNDTEEVPPGISFTQLLQLGDGALCPPVARLAPGSAACAFSVLLLVDPEGRLLRRRSKPLSRRGPAVWAALDEIG